MSYIASITEKGQITLPAEIRRLLRVKPGDQVSFNKKGQQVVIEPAKSFLNHKGSVKTTKIYTDKGADQAVSGHIKKTYAQKNSRS
ncbi:MAG: hypothetical protein UV73_C0005G0054 [Candidatus Gottesmanbacteria bacterium GW2011_GWA2_43_14]|uniref:SpoVT-AbrB domain-containing protein n=1 Tax=Candidatus Gottesmanbacteria bacterium GW2011_GWA2_43_14 TaxID=1618443 RepID=A0A0G1DJM8_9BACT|nr:MAG: hypothetical protein UV73_C0005G0054 [Candidatus Gottesmanbacteria bacterium GW2011_GWA2_43_14]